MKQNHSLWGSISLLIGCVIAILAFVRGTWLIPLLIGAFTMWGLWIVAVLLLPAWRSIRSYRRKERQAKRQQEQIDIALPGLEMAQTLLHHVNHRISAYLKAAYPNVRWEWTVKDPMLFVAQGGTGRIRVYGIQDFDYADVTLDQKANISCSLVRVVPVQGAEEQPAPPNRQPVDPQVWYETQGREILENLVADLNSRGHSSLTLKEDGSICITPTDGGAEVVQDSFRSFPEKVYWPRLAKVLEQEGLAATVQDNCIALAW